MKIITIDELLSILDEYDHKELHVHHTLKPDHSNFTGKNHLQIQDGMKNYHVNTKKWADIGQHVTLFPDGLFVTGRDFVQTPASIYGYNDGAFAVEMLGNFDKGHDKLEGKQLESIIKLAKYFYKKDKYIRFHRENAPKTCPGSGIDKEWFIDMVKKELPKIEDEVSVLYGKNVIPAYLTSEHKTVVEVRELAELLGFEVGWDGGSKSVIIRKPLP